MDESKACLIIRSDLFSSYSFPVEQVRVRFPHQFHQRESQNTEECFAHSLTDTSGPAATFRLLLQAQGIQEEAELRYCTQEAGMLGGQTTNKDIYLAPLVGSVVEH